MKGMISRPWGVSPGRDERAGHSVSAVPSHPCASSRAGVVLPPVRPAGDKGRKLSSRARGFVRDAVAVHLTVNRLARRGVHEQLPSRSPRHSPSATSSCPPARLRVCTPTAPPPLQPVLPLGLGYSSPLDRELLRFRGGTAFHCAAPAWHGGHPARTYAINPTSSLQGGHSMRDTEATRLSRAEQGPALVRVHTAPWMDLMFGDRKFFV